jgi:hypothetical protein
MTRGVTFLGALALLLASSSTAMAVDTTVNVIISGHLVIAAPTGACDTTQWPTDPNLTGCNYKWTYGLVQSGAQSKQVGGNVVVRGGKGQGSTCAFAGECWSNDYCEDGVCCATACGTPSGDCYYCKGTAAGGNGTCAVRPSGFECRPTAGSCDNAEVCNGSSQACPTDGFKSSGTVCRAAASSCDSQEVCTGTAAACPTDIVAAAGTLCRASAGNCDVAEYCTGSSGTCPANGYQPAGTLCDDANGNTYHDRCSGTSATCAGTTKTCPAATACVSYTAIADGTPDCTPNYVAAGTTCSDGLSCTTGEKCNGKGACVAQ